MTLKNTPRQPAKQKRIVMINMNYKLITLIALALCLCVMPAMAYESKYVPTDNSIKTDGCGELNVQTSNYHSLIGSTITIDLLKNTENLTFVNGARIDKMVADALVKDGAPATKELDHTGRFNDRMAPGIFLITLLDGNGGQPEYAIAQVVLSQKTHVDFIGHGVSMGGAPKPEYTCKLVIDSAKYGIKKNTPLDGNPGVVASETVWKWVGWKLRPLVVDNELHITANYPVQNYNALFGDPYKGVFKQLIVKFHYECTDGNTKKTTVCVWEDEDLNITKETTKTKCSVDDERDNTPV